MQPDLSSLPEWSRPWAEHRLSQASHDISREQWNGLRDWLTALPIERPKMPAKLYKLTMSQALDASIRWHEDIVRQAERIRADKADFGGDPYAVQVLADGGQGWRWVRVTTPEGLDYEGNAMGHCVGRGGYDDGKIIISLRDKHNMPHCTIEWDEDSRSVEQVQGRANGPVVEKYHKSVVSFINSLEPLAVHGAGKFGHVLVRGQLVHWSKLPDRLSVQYLDLEGCTNLTHLPDRLSVEVINLSGCTGITNLPNKFTADYVFLNGCTGILDFSDKLNTKKLDLSGCTGLTHLPDGLNARELNLVACTSLTYLPGGLTSEYLNLMYCTGLTYLPDGLNARYLYLSGCTGLTHLPDRLNARYLDIEGCTGLTSLPSDLNMDCRVHNGDHLIRRSTPGI